MQHTGLCQYSLKQMFVLLIYEILERKLKRTHTHTHTCVSFRILLYLFVVCICATVLQLLFRVCSHLKRSRSPEGGSHMM